MVGSTMKNYIIDCKFNFYIKFKSLELFIAELANTVKIENIQETPIVNIPKHIKKYDENLKNVPIYEIYLKEQEYKLLVGEEIFSIAIINQNYTSWKKSFKPLLEKMKIIFDFKSILKISKISLQYIDFFEFIIFEKGKISCTQILYENSLFLRERSFNDNIEVLKIITNEGKFGDKKGSIVDITTITQFDKDSFLIIVDKVHDININEFKKVVPDETIKELGL